MANLKTEFIATRSETIRLLYELADEIDAINDRSRKATIVGTAASIAGAVVGVQLGIAAIVLTAGAAAHIAIAGYVIAGIKGAGGLTLVGAVAGKYLHVNSKYKKALEALKKDEEVSTTFNAYRVATGTVSAVGVVAGGVKVGADIAEGVIKSGDAAVDALNVTSKVIKVAGIVGIAASAILLPINIYTLVVNLKDMKNDERHAKAKEIRKHAAELRNQLVLIKTEDQN